MGLEHFVARDGRALRLGFTTGTCAALAARAAAKMLLTGGVETSSSLVTPKGIRVTETLCDASADATEARCAVRKDAGDDPDATDGMLIYATVRKIPENAIRIEGGLGIGRVTRPGLDQPVGAAAINAVPREMIEREVGAVCAECGYRGGLSVIVSAPDGERRAARTFNPDLGIVGGISIIGTTGIVEPMSTRAIIDSMRVEMNVLRAEGAAGLVVTPGNYGETFIGGAPGLCRLPRVKCSNFIGEALDAAVEFGFEWVLAVGHIGKFVKLAGGVMNTHSRTADCRLELLALHAALAGAEPELLRRVLDAATVDDGLEALGGMRVSVIESLLERAEHHVTRRTGGALAAGTVFFSNRLGLLGVSKGAGAVLNSLEK